MHAITVLYLAVANIQKTCAQRIDSPRGWQHFNVVCNQIFDFMWLNILINENFPNKISFAFVLGGTVGLVGRRQVFKHSQQEIPVRRWNGSVCYAAEIIRWSNRFNKLITTCDLCAWATYRICWKGGVGLNGF